MVYGVFPIASLIGLFVRQISIPLATVIAKEAKQHLFFRQYVCMPPAQFYHWTEIRLKMWYLKLGKPVDIPQLREAAAIELGANLLGEFIIFSIAASVVTVEYLRNSRNNAKQQQVQEELNYWLMDHILYLHEKLDDQEELTYEMNRSLSKLGERIRIKPRKEIQK